MAVSGASPEPDMPGRECYHCKQWIEEGEAHDCWTTTEGALTADLAEDLRDAWERLREAMVELGEQRIYASGTCIMFSRSPHRAESARRGPRRSACHVFVRPKRKVLEICVFLDRALKDPRVKRADRSSKLKFANLVHIQHRDEVEAPLTDWLREAYALQDVLAWRKATPAPPAPARGEPALRATARPNPKPSPRQPAGGSER
jgi:hypothetical protein